MFSNDAIATGVPHTVVFYSHLHAACVPGVLEDPSGAYCVPACLPVVLEDPRGAYCVPASVPGVLEDPRGAYCVPACEHGLHNVLCSTPTLVDR